MTWVVGIPGMMSGAAIMADIRICRPDRSPITQFGVRKLHEVAPIMIAAFAGSVGPGLRTIEELRASLPILPPGSIFQVGSVARRFRKVARRTWYQACSAEKAVGLELMLIGAGLRPAGFPAGFPIARTSGWVLRAPSFALERMPLRRATSIGSGSSISEWITKLEEFTLGDDVGFKFTTENFNVIRAETHFPPGQAPVLFSFMLTRAMDERPEPTVGRELHLAWLSHEGLWLSTNEMEPFEPGEGSIVRMPPLAETYAEFTQLARQHRLAAALG